MSRPAIFHSLTSNDDLSPKARIRNAAIVEFGTHGVKGTSIRGIAKVAGVSPGMVQHYFKTKDQLRQACDQHILDVFAQRSLPAPPFEEASRARERSDFSHRSLELAALVVQVMTTGGATLHLAAR